MLIEKIRGLNVGTVIPKPQATDNFLIKGWGTRRGQPALLYSIPNHKSPNKPLVKGIAIAEFECAHSQLMKTGELTRAWFNSNLSACAKEGACNFTTIGGIFCLLSIAGYEGRGIYRLKAENLSRNAMEDVNSRADEKFYSIQDLNNMFDEILAEEIARSEATTADIGLGSQPTAYRDNDFAAKLIEIFGTEG